MTTRRSVAGDEPHPRPLEKPHHPTVGNFSVKRRKEVQEDMASRGRMTMGDQLRSSGVGGRAGGVIIDEEEEAWIKDQEAAMAKAEAPAAKVVRKPSRFAQLKQQQAAELEKKQDQTPVEADASPIDKKRTALTDLMSVIAMPVKERDPNLVPVVAPKARTTAFPVPLPREKQAPAAPTPPVMTPHALILHLPLPKESTHLRSSSGEDERCKAATARDFVLTGYLGRCMLRGRRWRERC